MGGPREGTFLLNLNARAAGLDDDDATEEAVPSADLGESRVGDDRAECFTGQSHRSETGFRNASQQSLQDAVAHSIDEERSRSAVCVRRRGHCVR